MIVDLTQMTQTGEMGFLVLTAAAAALTGLWRLRIFGHDRMQRLRLEAFRGAVPAKLQTSHLSWYRKLGRIIAASSIVGEGEQKRILKLLRMSGIKSRGSLASFVAAKVCLGVVLGALAWIAITWWNLFPGSAMLRYGVVGSALFMGWRLPDFVLTRIANRRRLRLENGLPDAMDLLVICSEAGLSLNQSIEEVSRHLYKSNKDVADEFTETAAEMRVLSDFTVALDNLVDRTGLADLRSLVATLKQSLKFGTPLAESVRMIAAEMRAAHQMRIEARAARLPVLLALPLMMFILPCLMMVVGTPAVIRVIDVFKTITIGGP